MMGPVRFDERGLCVAVVQHAATGEVLMVGYMNADALALTEQTRSVHFWSRSRGELWKKGETSGNTLALESLALDCDADALLVRARPAGPTCHTGTRSCFGEPGGGLLDALEGVIAARKLLAPGTRSYVRSLLDGGAPVLAGKLTEEAGELGAELAEGPRERVVAEAADLVFHTLCALAARDVPVAEVLDELGRRFGVSGHDEKASRKPR
jgi:phosphoribosyl-ATP pyrophosphohydrolase/phosphoribosyl-AMP cyclohydrolase